MLNEIKNWFSLVLNAFSVVEKASKKTGEWLLNHIYILICPIVAAVKTAYDFFSTLGQRMQDKLATIDIQSLQLPDGTPASVMNVLSFFNVFLPLNELAVWVVTVMLLWGVCMIIRTIKGVKQTVLF